MIKNAFEVGILLCWLFAELFDLDKHVNVNGKWN